MQVTDRLFIGGEWVAPAGTETIDVISPHSEETVGRVPAGTPADMDRAVDAARRAFDEGPWSRLALLERADLLDRLATVYGQRLSDMAQTITTEMGSPTSFSQMVQAPMPWMLLQYYVGLGRTSTLEEPRTGVLGDVLVRREPVGVVAAIVPWNVPQAVTMQKLAPALLAGCTVVLKPAEETPLDAVLLAELVEESGLPAGVLNVVPAGREVGEHLVTHAGVDKVSFTGSTAAGRRIASLCGERLKRCSLELGGKSAAIILDDADLETAVGALRFASFMNGGQACVAHSRILVSRRRHDEVVDALAEMVRSLRVGDPADPETEIGPLAAARQRDRVEGYIRSGCEQGAKAIVGGGRPAGQDRGWYVEPTMFVNVDNTMRIAREEIFGPVVAVIPFDDEADAVAIANDSDYGLAGSVYTADIDKGLDIARRVRTGTYAINQYMIDFAAPYGGFKCSGIGRENGPEGLHAFLEDKSIVVGQGHRP
ncbi:MAG TPA: aldehyde dehydrogenase [Acidimicrobiia bacterium]|nr:aldehyde dehydrogenase [Acidimicrobiia bacterium]